MPAHIEDYALLGNCRSAALVSRDGALDWLCLPRFDAPAVFAALLGNEENGRWRLAPCDPVTHSSRQYLGDTLVLETTWVTASGRARVLDLMPLGEVNSVVRIVEGLRMSLDRSRADALTANLDELYDYIGRRLLQANLSNDESALDECVSLMEPIREAWNAIGNQPEAKRAA